MIVFHEKGDNRDRHAHVVWSRIDVAEMKAIPMPFDRLRMKEVSRELFIEHGLDVPRGLINRAERSPLNFTLEEYQHAKRVSKDARTIKSHIQDAWALSDNAASLSAALQERGYRLARGDRRGFVAVDTQSEVFALPKWIGVKTKAVRDRLGPESKLPSVDEARSAIARDMIGKMDEFQAELKHRDELRKAEVAQQRRAMIERQRSERKQAFDAIKARAQREALERQSRFRKGLGGVWDLLRGENARIKAQNEREALAAVQRDREAKDRLILTQMAQRQQWRARAILTKTQARTERQDIEADRKHYVDMREAAREALKTRRGEPESRPRNRGPTLER